MNNKTVLHILLVFSIFWAGLSTLSYLLIGATLPALKEYYTANTDILPEQFYTMMMQMFDVPRAYFFSCAVIYAFEVLGAVLMWRLHRSGFHCYTLSRLLLVLLPLLFLGRGAVAMGDVMLALLFILVYYLLLRQLGVFGGNGDDNPDSPSPATPADGEGGEADSNP